MEYFFNLADNSFLDSQGFTVFAVDLDAQAADGSPNTAATINVIDALGRVDVDPTNDGTGAFSVFDNVPYTSANEMVAFQSITGSGTISGTVFDDLDRNGVKDNGEVGLQGVRVFSDDFKALLETAPGSSGTCEFSNHFRHLFEHFDLAAAAGHYHSDNRKAGAEYDCQRSREQVLLQHKHEACQRHSAKQAEHHQHRRRNFHAGLND